jgi:hypothetical protein
MESALLASSVSTLLAAHAHNYVIHGHHRRYALEHE